MNTQDALLEIGCEELPVDYIPAALRQLQAMAEKQLTEARLPFGGVETEATPRRLCLRIRNLALAQPDHRSAVSGPTTAVACTAEGGYTPAGQGFLRKLGITGEQVQVRDGRLWAEVEEKGRPTESLLPDIFTTILRGLTFPKSMRWESSGARFARPVRTLLALLGDRTIPVSFADVTSGPRVRLHPGHTPREGSVQEADHYETILLEGGVILRQSDRRTRVLAEIEREAARLGGRWLRDEGLLDMVCWMSEAPAVLSGGFDRDFLALPKAIIVTTLREHQRFFSVEDADGRLLPFFLAVYDNPQAVPEQVRRGCERVLEARLKDAEFFYQEDLKVPLAQRVPELARVLWIKGMGTLLDKTRRLEILGDWLSGHVEPKLQADLRQAAHLAKADLITNMIGEKEFTSLQGEMGGIYALLQGSPEPVATAIREHYQPRGAGDPPPRTPLGRLLALSDKLDHLVGCWGAGFVPTGAKDPYALRRAAAGVVAITLESGYRYPLAEALRQAALGFDQLKDQTAKVTAEVKTFVLGRLETELAQRGFSPDLVQALLAVGVDDLTAVRQKAETLATLKTRADFNDTVTSFSRVVNILPKTLPRDVPASEPLPKVVTNLLTAPAERDLYAATESLPVQLEILCASGDYFGLYQRLAQTVPAIHRFFDEVLVMDPDPAVRENRLNLLHQLARQIWTLADFSRLVLPG